MDARVFIGNPVGSLAASFSHRRSIVIRLNAYVQS